MNFASLGLAESIVLAIVIVPFALMRLWPARASR